MDRRSAFSCGTPTFAAMPIRIDAKQNRRQAESMPSRIDAKPNRCQAESMKVSKWPRGKRGAQVRVAYAFRVYFEAFFGASRLKIDIRALILSSFSRSPFLLASNNFNRTSLSIPFAGESSGASAVFCCSADLLNC